MPGEDADARAVPRKNLFLAATIFHGSARSPVKVRNMSEQGAMVESGGLPETGKTLSLVRGGLAVDAKVIWRLGERCGVSFASDVAVPDWIAPARNAEQGRVDRDVAMVRAGTAPLPSPAVPTPFSRTSGTVAGQLMDDLAMAVRLLADLGDDLINHPATVAIHGLKLQNIDLASQVLNAVGGVMACQAEGRTISLAQLNELRVSCSEALKRPR